ncbi:DegV family protein [Companilactobacillus sp. DQM5]|uniref:DegV family protein n=1 Tax=Companilactobacillus sp. DQM5 TaxID=3463359 RepID=UPI00405A0087
MTIHLVTDSTAQLTQEEIKKYSIHVIPLIINNGKTSLKDGIDISSNDFLNQIKSDKAFSSTTSQPAVGDFAELYESLGNPEDEIISIHLTNLLSGTVDGAFSAASLCDKKVTVIDSKLMDRALGEQVLLAAELISQGENTEEIISALESSKTKKDTFIFFNSLDALQRGGRISKTSGLISKFLKIKVLLKLEDNNLKLVTKGHGKKFISKSVSDLLDDLKNEELKTFSLIHVGINEEDIELIKQQVLKDHPQVIFKDLLTSPIIMNHVGLGTFAFIFSKQ